MNENIAKVASLISDPSRAAILTHLMDGHPHPATELARVAKIKPQTVSFHLHKLYTMQILEVEKHGRYHYYKLANQEMAEILGKLLYIVPFKPIQSFKEIKKHEEIQYARTCYDHLAGKLGVGLTNSLLYKQVLQKNGSEFEVTEIGAHFFEDFGINLDILRNKRRAFSKCCLDWTERQYHIAGALGNAILERMLEQNWITRTDGSRAVYITSLGKQNIFEIFSLEM
ncbi:ArsR/SmtB family transcription factor [Bacillus cytotoxicus]|uniref:ArsR/SmtB family transcription factor n=1 Tax=Bacillus cereus group TaxID=86661 RepID=UPI001F586CDB|nr:MULTISPECIES: helix-turn-helix domain-containing protein [Bacillus cereus group]MDH2880336.1 helix-turn-helix domain-containing protein [Bacillus cytotoxicus]MDH2888301.1 helix-turn-helix domain-containing protein [Bacillus cytotoxicus]